MSALAALDIILDSAAKLPVVIIHHKAKNQLLLIEPVIKGGLVDEKRRQELQNLFAGSDAHLVFVTAFENRRAMQTFGSEIAWESEVWSAEEPDHMIHFWWEKPPRAVSSGWLLLFCRRHGAARDLLQRPLPVDGRGVGDGVAEFFQREVAFARRVIMAVHAVRGEEGVEVFG